MWIFCIKHVLYMFEVIHIVITWVTKVSQVAIDLHNLTLNRNKKSFGNYSAPLSNERIVSTTEKFSLRNYKTAFVVFQDL